MFYMCFTYVSDVSDNYQQNIKINSSSIATQYNSNDAQSSTEEEVDWVARLITWVGRVRLPSYIIMTIRNLLDPDPWGGEAAFEHRNELEIPSPGIR